MLPEPPAQIEHVPYSERDRQIIAATLIGEAGGEGLRGMHAVLNVIMNRAGGDVRNASRVCLAPRAFGYWNNKEIVENIEGARTHPCWMQALALIDRALRGQLPDITGGANHFYNPHLARPSWSNEMQRTARIGHHVFLKDE